MIAGRSGSGRPALLASPISSGRARSGRGRRGTAGGRGTELCPARGLVGGHCAASYSPEVKQPSVSDHFVGLSGGLVVGVGDVHVQLENNRPVH